MISFYVDNLIEQSTITASTENAQFSKSNIQDYRRTKVFRSTSNSDNVVFDTQETSNIDSVVVVDNWDSGFGISTLTIQGNATDTWGAPEFSESITLNTKHGVGYKEFSSTESVRFARAVMTSTLGYCELSKIFIGEKLTIGSGRSINYGWTFKDEELSNKSVNRYGQVFTDVITKRRVYNIAFSLLTKDELDDIFMIYDNRGETKPFFVRIGCADMTNEIERLTAMVYMKSSPTITNTSFNRYSVSMTLEEAM